MGRLQVTPKMGPATYSFTLENGEFAERSLTCDERERETEMVMVDGNGRSRFYGNYWDSGKTTSVNFGSGQLPPSSTRVCVLYNECYARVSELIFIGPQEKICKN